VLFSNVFIGDTYLKSYDAAIGGLRLKAKPHAAKNYFSVFEAFSFLLDDGMAGWLAKKR